MRIELKKARTKLGISIEEIAKAADISESFYKQYEDKNEIPCKYVYNIWKKYPDFPIPEDFFYYTSFTLQTNMTFHHVSQDKLAKIFGYSSQGVMSRILSDNIPMYEMKDMFLEAFDPLIVPLKKNEEGYLRYMTDLVAKGNFMHGNKKKKKHYIRDGDEHIQQMELEEIENQGFKGRRQS